MTAAGKSLVERLGWHHEHPVTGKMVLVNPDGPEAAAEIEILRNLVDERTNDAAKEWERAEATESRLATLLAPSEGDKTTAEERRAARELLDDPDNDIENEFVLRLLDDLDHATAQARRAADTIKKLRMELGYEPDEELIAMAGGATTMLQAATGPKRDFDPSIRASRKGEPSGTDLLGGAGTNFSQQLYDRRVAATPPAPSALDMAVEALEFYADPKNWWNRDINGNPDYHNWDGVGQVARMTAVVGVVDRERFAHPHLFADAGDRARAALEAIRGNGGGT